MRCVDLKLSLRAWNQRDAQLADADAFPASDLQRASAPKRKEHEWSDPCELTVPCVACACRRRFGSLCPCFGWPGAHDAAPPSCRQQQERRLEQLERCSDDRSASLRTRCGRCSVRGNMYSIGRHRIGRLHIPRGHCSVQIRHSHRRRRQATPALTLQLPLWILCRLAPCLCRCRPFAPGRVQTWCRSDSWRLSCAAIHRKRSLRCNG